MLVNPGELNKKIIIGYIEKVKDSDGFWTENEVIFRNCYAKVSNSTGSELIQANAEFANTKVRFFVRYSKKEVTNKMFVKFAGSYYDIEYINDYEYSHEYLEIYATKRELV